MTNPKIVVATKAIICFEGKYLILRRSAVEETGAGTWEFPGGKLEFYESVEDCVVREVHEETGLDIEISALGYVTDFLTSETRKVVLIDYICRADSDNVILSEEHTAYKWVSKDELAREIAPDIAESMTEYGVWSRL